MENDAASSLLDEDAARDPGAGSTTPADEPSQMQVAAVEPPIALIAAEASAPMRVSGARPDAAQILQDRPDVFRAFFEEYYGPRNDPHSSAWANRVGAATPEAYAEYWYKTHGEMAGYGQPGATPINVAQILTDRPDVFRAFFTEYYGPNNDRHSPAWVDRVGGETVEDYAAYWYRTYGRNEGYTQGAAQAPAGEEVAPPAPAEQFQPVEASEPGSDMVITTVGQSLTSSDAIAG